MAMNKRKTTTAVVAGVAAVALILGGTFAWTSISQEAKNETIVDINPGGRLHDDFNGTNKDVYVENFGDNETGVPIFARIRLDEYMEVGPDAGINKNDPDRSVTVLYPDGETEPKINDTSTWITYKPGDSIDTNPAVENKDRKYGYYWDWSLGNDDQNLPYYMPTFNKNKDSLKADINGTYEGNITGDALHYDDYVPYKDGDSATKDATYDWDEDTAEDYVDETRDENTPFDTVDVLKKQETHKATKISTTAEVITMAEWLAPVVDGGKGGARGDFWVYDEDGWAYWANPIEPGKTTGLLLDGINMSRTPGDNWYYGINVVAQFATASDLGMFAAPTDNAKELLQVISVDETIKAILTANGTLDDGSTAYTLSFVNDRETYTADDVATTAEGLEVTPIATYNGADIVAVYDDLVGRKVYTRDGGSSPWYEEYAASVTAVSIDTEMAPISTAFWFDGMINLTSIEGLEKIDTTNTTQMGTMFYKCSSLTELDLSKWNVENVTNMCAMFAHCTNLEKIVGIGGWDTSNVTDLSFMFEQCDSLQTLDIGNWEVGNVVTMQSMFASGDGLTQLDLSGWDTSNVTDMYAMFFACTGLTSLNVDGWDTSNVTNMYYMFNGCTNLTTITGIENFKTENVTNMESMFNSSGITGSLDLSGWRTDNVKNMRWIFLGCSNLTELNVSNWNVSNVTDMQGLFRESPRLEKIVGIENWDTSSAKDIHAMFYLSSALKTVDISSWDTSNVTDMQSMFRGCSALETITFGEKWDTSNATNMNSMFMDCTGLTQTIDCSKWDVSMVGSGTRRAEFAKNAPNVIIPDAWTTAYVVLVQNGTDADSNPTYAMNFVRSETEITTADTYEGSAIAAVFTDFEKLDVTASADLPWNSYRGTITTVNIENNLYPVSTRQWFASMASLTSVEGLENIDTSNTLTMSTMFWKCSSLTSLDGMSEWDLSKVEAINSLFSQCTSLASVGDISDWNVSNVKNMQAVFYMTAFSSIDISGWDTGNATNMIDMFGKNSNLQSISLGTGWNTGNVTNMLRMFCGCTSLTIDCSTWDVTNVANSANFRETSETDVTPISTITPPNWVN